MQTIIKILDKRFHVISLQHVVYSVVIMVYPVKKEQKKQIKKFIHFQFSMHSLYRKMK
jgi:hypothetical protein